VADFEGKCAGCAADLEDPDLDSRDAVNFTPDILCFGRVEDVGANRKANEFFPFVVFEPSLPDSTDFTWCSDQCFAKHLLKLLSEDRLDHPPLFIRYDRGEDDDS